MGQETWEILQKVLDETTPGSEFLRTSSGGGGGGAVTIANGADVTQGAKADARDAATDTTAITIMQVLKQISYMAQNPAATAITNANLDIALSALRNAIAGTSPNNKTLYDVLTGLIGSSSKTLTDVVSALASVPVTNTYLDSSLSGIKSDLDIIAGQACLPVSGQATASGDTTIIAATSLKKIRIYKIYAQNIDALAVAVYFKIIQGSATVNIVPATLCQYQMVSDNIRAGQKFYECDTNTLVAITLGAAGHVNWQIDYALV